MFFIFHKNIKNQQAEIAPVPEKKVKARPTWTDSDENSLRYLFMRAEDAHDQTIWIHNQITYFSYQLQSATEEYEKERNREILSGWRNKMKYEKSILSKARADMEPLLEKKQRFEEYDEEDED